MTAPGSPAVRRRRLAAELRRLRGSRTGGQVSSALGWSPSKVSRFEQGRDRLPLDEVQKLLDFYGVSDPERDRLLSLARDAQGRGWWEDYADALPEEYQTFIGLEAEAASEVQWQAELIPGLLQTEKYARQLFANFQRVIPTLTPTVIDQRVTVRMIRQELLTRDPPFEHHVVIDESVLLRNIGGPEVMYAQLLRLAEAADLPDVKLQVLPLGSNVSMGFSSFVIFHFGPGPTGKTGALGDVVSTEGVNSGLNVDDEHVTHIYRLVFQAYAEAALPSSESQNLIRRTAERIWTPLR
jgi:transcriptional regulator with XRE-family HTH domain